MAGGDYNAKHTYWGCRTISPNCRQLLSALNKLKLTCISSREPTHWPTDKDKKPDLIDSIVVKGIASTYFAYKSMSDLSSDHSPVEIVLKRNVTETPNICRLLSRTTD